MSKEVDNLIAYVENYTQQAGVFLVKLTTIEGFIVYGHGYTPASAEKDAKIKLKTYERYLKEFQAQVEL